MKTVLLVLGFGIVLVAALLGVLAQFHGSEIGVHGWIALAIGGVLSILVGGGLMALMFFSARAGYDDRVQSHMDEDPDDYA